MELEGLRRGLLYLKNSNITIVEVVTDRHEQVKKYMRTEHTDKIDSFDCWHICKGICLQNEFLQQVVFSTYNLLHLNTFLEDLCTSYILLTITFQEWSLRWLKQVKRRVPP